MYQFSLGWFKNLFEMAVREAPGGKDKNEKILNMQETFTYMLYCNVCKGIFDRHKLILSLNLTAQLMFNDNKLDETEFRYFLTGYLGGCEVKPNCADWIDNLSWKVIYKEIHGLSKEKSFKGFEN